MRAYTINSSLHNTMQTSPNKAHFERELAIITEALNPNFYQHKLDAPGLEINGR